MNIYKKSRRLNNDMIVLSFYLRVDYYKLSLVYQDFGSNVGHLIEDIGIDMYEDAYDYEDISNVSKTILKLPYKLKYFFSPDEVKSDYQVVVLEYEGKTMSSMVILKMKDFIL